MGVEIKQEVKLRNVAFVILAPTLFIYVMLIVGVYISDSFYQTLLEFLYFDLFENKSWSLVIILVFGFLGVLIGWIFIRRRKIDMSSHNYIFFQSFLI